MPEKQGRLEWMADDLCVLADEMHLLSEQQKYPTAVQEKIRLLQKLADELAELLDI